MSEKKTMQHQQSKTNNNKNCPHLPDRVKNRTEQLKINKTNYKNFSPMSKRIKT